jgi:hypothetical protein
MRWLLAVASGPLASPEVASLASRRESIPAARLSRNCLNMSQNFRRAGEGCFQLDSPVKWPDAGKLPRSAPPYTDRALEEPCKGEGAPCLVPPFAFGSISVI